MLRSWWKNFINLIYPLSCLICKVKISPLSDKPLCPECWNKIELILPPFCRVCGKHLPKPPQTSRVSLPAKKQNLVFICKDCQASFYFFTQAHSVCVYDGIIKECIHLFKYSGKLSLMLPLSQLMIDFAHKFLEMKKVNLILPVPLHKTKLRQRQFNQAQLLAIPLAKEFSLKLHNKVLIKIKPGPAQVNLSQAQRQKNVRGSFKVLDVQAVKNKNVLLVDDVLTTKATANECAKTLLAHGANSVEVFTLAQGV